MLNWNLLATFLAGAGLEFTPFLAAKQSTAEITPTTNTNTPTPTAPIMIPRFELEDAGAGVLSGDGGGAGGAAVVTGGAAVLAGCAAVVVTFVLARDSSACAPDRSYWWALWLALPR
jgi:hypothetical protein